MNTADKQIADILAKYGEPFAGLLQRLGCEPTGLDECWFRPGTDTRRYCHVRIDGRKTQAHREAYRLAFGVDPTGFVVMHKCDRPGCFNPRHLIMGTHADNIADRMIKGRTAHGRGVASAKLDERIVRSMRAMAAEGHDSRAVAHAHGVHTSTAHRIVTRRTWRHVP